jgi:hypothetical protein
MFGQDPNQMQQGGPPQMMGPPQQFPPNPMAATQGIVDTMDPSGQFGVNTMAPQSPMQRGLQPEEQSCLAYLDGVNELFKSIEINLPALSQAVGQARQILVQAVSQYMQTGQGTPGMAPPPSPFGGGSPGPAPTFGGGMEGAGPENIPIPTL